jgi:hypothetical protein
MLILRKIKVNLLITVCFIIFACLQATAQKVKINNMGQAIAKFINNKKVIDWFSREYSHSNDSLLVIADLWNVLNGHSINTWRGIKTKVLKEGELIDSLKTFDANYLVGRRCNIYVLLSRKENDKSTIVTLQHACTNIVSTVTITEKNRKFYLSKIENAVW